MAIVPINEINLLHSNICRALGDPKRIQILYALSNRPYPVSALAKVLNSPQSTMSRHLAVLRQCALVTTERDGTSIIYHLAEPQIIDILDSMRQVLRRLLERQSDALE
jgi:DNA-binding transcriptional ArsR family regulator